MNKEKQNNFSIYVLKLEQGKFYVGVTSKTPEERFREHQNGFYGAEWTKLYKPIAIEQTKSLGYISYKRAEDFENLVTRKYIEKYGLNNVRGGNLTYRGPMVRRFGYFWRTNDWKDILYGVFILVWIFISTIYILWDLYVRHHWVNLFQ